MKYFFLYFSSFISQFKVILAVGFCDTFVSLAVLLPCNSHKKEYLEILIVNGCCLWVRHIEISLSNIHVSSRGYEQKFLMIIWHCRSQLKKCWFERDLSSQLRDTGPPLYLLSHRVHRDWRRVLSNFNCTRYSRDIREIFSVWDILSAR